MHYQEILEKQGNTTLANALQKMIMGYQEGYHRFHRSTCYAYVGAELANLNPSDAIIRLWGRKSSGIIVHGDAVLPDGNVISSISPDFYSQKGYELVRELSLEEFMKNLLPNS